MQFPFKFGSFPDWTHMDHLCDDVLILQWCETHVRKKCNSLLQQTQAHTKPSVHWCNLHPQQKVHLDAQSTKQRSGFHQKKQLGCEYVRIIPKRQAL